MTLNHLRGTVTAAALASVIVIPISRTSQAPRTNFKPADFKSLRWLEGDWVGSGGGYDAFYERYTFVDDSTIEQQSFADGTMTKVTDRATIALRAGRISSTSANSRYDATTADANGISFVPARPGSNSFTWKRAARGAWLATLQHPGGKRTVYEMKPKKR